MLSRPVRHHESLESKLVLENPIQRVVVLAGIRPVDEVVRTHHRRDPSHDTTQERSDIDLMLGAIIDVRTLLRALVLLLAVPSVSQYVTLTDGQSDSHLLM